MEKLVITQGGKFAAVIVTPEEYERLNSGFCIDRLDTES